MELEYESEEQNGFEELFNAIGADSKTEVAEAEIFIYREVENILTETSASVNHPEKMTDIGETVASDYAEFTDYLDNEDELTGGFYEMGVRERLEHVRKNSALLDYFD
ncbi:MAG: hypothetical protein ACI8Z7_000365 [Candidatus Nanohaloarchaea archaeon]|jgi:hypothetical protein